MNLQIVAFYFFAHEVLKAVIFSTTAVELIAHQSWLQHTIYCASLLAKVMTLASSRILYLVYFAQLSGQVRGQVGLIMKQMNGCVM